MKLQAATPINRTGYAAPRRVTGWEGICSDIVPVGPSASENAEGAGTLPTPDAFSRYARVTASSDTTGRPVTAMPEGTSLDAARTTDTPTSVYRYYDAEGRLIYVGVTSRGPQRQAQHAITAEWWPHVRAQDVEHYDNRETALRREKWLIERHRPPFNRQHNPAHEERKAGYLELVSPMAARCGHCEECQAAAQMDPEYVTPGECVIANGVGKDCRHCGSDQCVYPEGHRDGSLEGWAEGFNTGTGSAWAAANEQYAPAHQADYLLRAVIDGAWPGAGYWNMPAAEKSLRDMEADIAEHGIAALVAKAAEVPF